MRHIGCILESRFLLQISTNYSLSKWGMDPFLSPQFSVLMESTFSTLESTYLRTCS